MRYRSFLLVGCLVCLFQVVTATQKNADDHESYFLEPKHSILPVIAYQPECPLEYKKVVLLHNIQGGSIDIQQLYNKSDKPIKACKFALITSAGTGREVAFNSPNPDQYIMPGQTVPGASKESLQIVPLTEGLAKQHKITADMIGIAVFMVVHVEFADGSSYDARHEYEALKKFFEKNAILSDARDKKR
jgi:hypothetical protein